MPKITMWALVPVLAALAGCALPPALTIISLATNAASYAATGKSVTDHGISAVVGEDCALWRVLADRKICTDDSAVLASPAPSRVEDQTPKAPTVAERGIDKALAEPTQEVAAVPKAGRFLVLGSFINRINAQHLAASIGGIETVIVTVDLNGATYHRVVAGPLSDMGFDALRERMALEAAARPWETADPGAKPRVAANPMVTRTTQTTTARLPLPANAADLSSQTQSTASTASRS